MPEQDTETADIASHEAGFVGLDDQVEGDPIYSDALPAPINDEDEEAAIQHDENSE